MEAGMEGVLNSSSLAEHHLASWPSALRMLLWVHRGWQHYPPWTLPALQTIQVGLASLPLEGKGPSPGCPKEMPTLCSFPTVIHLESGQYQRALLTWYVGVRLHRAQNPLFLECLFHQSDCISGAPLPTSM